MASAIERVRKDSKKYEPAVLKISPSSQCLSVLTFAAAVHASHPAKDINDCRDLFMTSWYSGNFTGAAVGVDPHRVYSAYPHIGPRQQNIL